MGQKKQFIQTVSDWADSLPGSGTPRIHNAFAQTYDANKDYYSAEKHYLKGSNNRAYVEMLLKSLTLAPKAEYDLFIARTVLRYVFVQKLDQAEDSLYFFLSRVPSLERTPLISFLFFMLKAIQTKSQAIFQLLRQKYAVALSRDPSFEKYLQQIAKLYFGINVPPQGGFLGSLMNSIFSQK